MRYSDIDPILRPWAESRSLYLYTRQHDEQTRVMAVVDDAGDTYHLWAIPDPKDPDYPDASLATVGVSLIKRGDKQHHAFYREARQFTFRQSVSLSQVSTALDEAWQRVNEWIAQAGHTRTLS